MYDAPQISVLILVGQWFGSRGEITNRIRDHVFITRNTNYGFSHEARLILSNRFSLVPIAPEAWSRIYEAFEKHFGF
jgi:hypothetical protein